MEELRKTDGTVYCDAGREIERKLFNWIHKDDRSVCHQYSLELHEVSGAFVSGRWPMPHVMDSDGHVWQGGKDVTVPCTDEPETPTEQIAAFQYPWRAILNDWVAAREYAKARGISPQDALQGFPFSEGYEGV